MKAVIHLHYDAQADLVQMLGRQQVAKKIIYSTHSAGCLPEDLGHGVRLVDPNTPDTTKIVNRFWGNTDGGFDPLLIGMGASTLAFFPVRKALVVEGEAEMLLLPTLLREALAVDLLGFQVVPGLSRMNKTLLPANASRNRGVGYLVDCDEGGRNLKRELGRNSVPAEAIFELRVGRSGNSSFEDVVEPRVLIDSCNELIRKFSPGSPSIATKTLPTNGKFAKLAADYLSATSKELNKIDLAYEVLCQTSEAKRELIDARAQDQFRALARSLVAFFYPSAGR